LQLLIFRQDAPLISPDHATCRSDLPRERFSPLAQMRSADPVAQCPSSEAKRTTFTRGGYFALTQLGHPGPNALDTQLL
jgi:hypothetical protein